MSYLTNPQNAPAPAPKKKRTGLKITLGVIVALVVVVALFSGGDKSADKPAVAGPAKDTQAPAPKKNATEEFKAFIDANGIPADKAAVAHVTKVQGADKMNNVLDSASIYTDLEGGLMSKDSGTAKLIVSAFADWRESKNGLVTVYGANGEIISNGQF